MRKQTIILALVALMLPAPLISAQTMSQTDQKNISAPQEKGTRALVKTSLGEIKILLYDDTPGHRDNFIKVAKDGVYDGTLFHRVIKDFMVQCGDPNSKNAAPGAMLGAGDLGYTQPAEIDYPKHYHKYGALAAARTGDEVNPERRSSASQFYIVTGKKYQPMQLEAYRKRAVDQERQKVFRGLVMENRQKIDALQAANDSVGLENLRQELISLTEASVKNEPLPAKVTEDYATVGGTPFLDGQYTVFGEVLEGMDVVEKIQNVEVGAADRPKEDIKILSVTIL